MNNTTAANADEPPLPARRADRPLTRLHRFEYLLVWGLIAFFRLLGVDRSSAVAGAFMRLLGPRLNKYSDRGDANLRNAFPQWTAAERKKVLGDVWDNLGRTGAEYAHLAKFNIDGAQPRITHDGFDRLRNGDGTFQQVIFVTGHFANWEIPAICAKQLGISFGVIYRAANNPLVDEMIIRTRAATMTRIQSPKGRRGARGLVEMLRGGYSIAMLVDQKLNDGISVPFLGREAMTAPAAARMALKFNVPLVPISTERLNGAYFHVTAHEPVAFNASGDVSADVYALTKKINETLERFIEQRPGQWLWLHRRWPKKHE